MSTTKPVRDDGRCASQEEVDDRFRRLKGEYRFCFSDAREQEADSDTGALVCTVISFMVPENEASYMNVREDVLAWQTENPIADDLLDLIGWHAKDVALRLREMRQEGVFDTPSPTH